MNSELKNIVWGFLSEDNSKTQSYWTTVLVISEVRENPKSLVWANFERIAIVRIEGGELLKTKNLLLTSFSDEKCRIYFLRTPELKVREFKNYLFKINLLKWTKITTFVEIRQLQKESLNQKTCQPCIFFRKIWPMRDEKNNIILHAREEFWMPNNQQQMRYIIVW